MVTRTQEQQQNRRPKHPAMTPEQATTFGRYSLWNAASAAGHLKDSGACKTGNCQPYEDIFTYARWQALGFQVRRGEHGAKIPVIGLAEDTDEEGKIVSQSFKTTSAVFCRCQVDRKETRNADR